MESLQHMLLEAKAQNFSLLTELVSNPRDVQNILTNFYEGRHSEGICCKSPQIAVDSVICMSSKKEIAAGAVGKIYLLTYENDKFILKESTIGNTFGNYSDKPTTNLDIILKKNHIAECFGSIDPDNTVYIALDEFSNESIIAYMLDNAFTAYGMPELYVKHYTSGICNYLLKSNVVSTGLNLMEYCDLGDLKQFGKTPATEKYIEGTLDGNPRITGPVMSNIMIQLMTMLDFAQNTLNFVSGDFKPDNVLLDNREVEYTYKGVHVNGYFTLKLSDYGKSSCVLKLGQYLTNNVRVFPYNVWSAYHSKAQPFNPDIEVIDGTTVYTVDYLLPVQVFTYMRHVGWPFFASYDIYTMWCLLMSDELYRNALLNDASLYDTFWVPLWLSREMANEVMNDLIHADLKRMSGVIQFLKGRKLKCQALQDLWNAIQTNLFTSI